MTSKLPLVVMIRNGQVLFVAIHDERQVDARALSCSRCVGVVSIDLWAWVVAVTGGARPASPRNARRRAGDSGPA